MNLFHRLSKKNIVFDIIALQELWSLPDPDKFFISGYQKIIFKSRNKTRGGGVGFYVKQGLKVKLIENLSVF